MCLGFLLFSKSGSKETKQPETEEEEVEATNADAVVRLRGAAGIFFVLLGAIVMLGAIFKTLETPIADTPKRVETMEQPASGKPGDEPARPSRPAPNPAPSGGGTGGGGGGASGGWSPGTWGGSSRGTTGKWIPQEDTIGRHEGGDSSSTE